MQAKCPFFYDLTLFFLDLCQFVDTFRPIFTDITPTGKLCFGDIKTPFFVSLTLCFHSVKPMFSPRQSYVFRSHMCHFGSHKVTPRRQQSATSTGNKSHIDRQQVPHRQATSPTSTGSKSHIGNDEVVRRREQ